MLLPHTFIALHELLKFLHWLLIYFQGNYLKNQCNAVNTEKNKKGKRVHCQLPWSTIIHVLFTVVALVAIDTDAGVATLFVGTCGTVLAGVVAAGTFVHILWAVLAWPLEWALAGVRVDPVDALAAVLAKMSGAVVNVVLTSCSDKSLNNNFINV